MARLPRLLRNDPARGDIRRDLAATDDARSDFRFWRAARRCGGAAGRHHPLPLPRPCLVAETSLLPPGSVCRREAPRHRLWPRADRARRAARVRARLPAALLDHQGRQRHGPAALRPARQVQWLYPLRLRARLSTDWFCRRSTRLTDWTVDVGWVGSAKPIT